MPLHQELVADSLGILSDKRQSAQAIDDCYGAGNLALGDLVMTSMGTYSQAVVTPAYPAFAFEPKLLQRLDWAATLERPFVEAVIGVTFDKGNSLKVATVGLRLCMLPRVGAENRVLQTSASYMIDSRREYGSTDQVIDAVRDARSEGVAIREQTGIVIVPKTVHRSKKGKWAVSKPISDTAGVAHVINSTIIEDLKFVEL